MELNGIFISKRADPQTIAQTLNQMKPGGKNILTLHRPPADFVQVMGDSKKGFTLNYYEDAKGSNIFSKKTLQSNSILQVLTDYLSGNPHWIEKLSWQSSIEKQRKAQRRTPGMAGLIAFGIFATAYLTAGIMIWKNRPPGFTWTDYARGWIGIFVISSYISWADFFFSSLRPRLARWLGTKFGVRITESMRLYDAGTWEASGGNSGKRWVIYAVDIFILVSSLMLPLAVPAVIAFILFER